MFMEHNPFHPNRRFISRSIRKKEPIFRVFFGHLRPRCYPRCSIFAANPIETGEDESAAKPDGLGAIAAFVAPHPAHAAIKS